jgi:hypothetical protein
MRERSFVGLIVFYLAAKCLFGLAMTEPAWAQEKVWVVKGRGVVLKQDAENVVPIYTTSVGLTLVPPDGQELKLSSDVVIDFATGESVVSRTIAARHVMTSWSNRKTGTHPEGAWFEVELPAKFPPVVMTLKFDGTAIGPYRIKFDTTEYAAANQKQATEQKQVVDAVIKLGWPSAIQFNEASNIRSRMLAIGKALIIVRGAKAAKEAGVKLDSVRVASTDDDVIKALSNDPENLPLAVRFLGLAQEAKWPVVYEAAVKKYTKDGRFDDVQFAEDLGKFLGSQKK